MNFDRFDFEQQILKCWNLIDQLDVITEGVLEYEWTPDQVSNATLGLKELASVEMDKLFRMLETGIEERKIV